MNRPPKNQSVSEAQRKVLANARTLLVTAELLEAHGRLRHAAHFATLCEEECAKCLLLMDSVQALFSSGARTDHFAKGKLIGMFHYLAGKLSMVFVVGHVGTSLMPEANEWRLLQRYLLDRSGATRPGYLGALAVEYLSELQREPRMDIARTTGDVRKNSVYCDVVNDTALVPEDRVSDEQALRTIAGARLAVGLVEMALEQSFKWERFFSILPTEYGDPRAEAEQHLTELRKRISDGELEQVATPDSDAA